MPKSCYPRTKADTKLWFLVKNQLDYVMVNAEAEDRICWKINQKG